MELDSRITDSCASRIPAAEKRRRSPRHRGAARDRRGRRSRGAPLSGILRRHHPQQEHAASLSTTPSCGSLPGVDRHTIGEIADIVPLHVAAYIEALGKDFEKPTVKQHLAAIRMLFDWLVTASLPQPGQRRGQARRQTANPVLPEARELLDSIDTSTLVGLRDRALISVMTFAFARIGAVVAMRVEDYYPKGKRWWVRLHEKGGKRHEMPAHHTLEAYLNSYIEAAGIRDGGKSPLFRSAVGRTGTLTDKPMHRVDAWRMIQRRAAELGTRARIGCHTFRATGITAYLEAGGTLENAQAMAAHESPRTTKLYDRTGDEITLEEVERITI